MLACMIDDPKVLTDKSLKCRENYIRAKTIWIIDRRSPETSQKSHALALLYDVSLDNLLTSLNTNNRSASVREQIRGIIASKTLLAKDLKVFAAG